MQAGTFYVRGVVHNGCSVAAGVQHKFTFYDKAGGLTLVSDQWLASIKNIPASSDWPFETIVNAGNFTKYTIQPIDVRVWKK